MLEQTEIKERRPEPMWEPAPAFVMGMKEKAQAVICIVIMIMLLAAAFMPKGPPQDAVRQQIKNETMIQ